MEITQTVKAWLPPHCMATPEEMTDPERIQLSQLTYTNLTSDMSEYGYTPVGIAHVTFEIPNRRSLIEAKVSAMRSEVKTIRAEAEAKANLIESQISNLLAIEYTPS